MSNKEYANRLGDVGVHINAALAVAREANECAGSRHTFQFSELSDHLIYLSEAVVILLDGAAKMAQELGDDMDRAA